MAQKQLSEMTEDELKKNIKLMTGAVAILSVSILIMFVSVVFSYTKKGFTATVVLPFAFMPIAILNVINLRKMKAELASRTNK